MSHDVYKESENVKRKLKIKNGENITRDENASKKLMLKEKRNSKGKDDILGGKWTKKRN